MSSTLPSRDNGYAIPLRQIADRAFFEAVFGDVHARLVAVEATRETVEEVIARLTTQALAIISANITEEVEAQRGTLAAIREAADTIIAEVEAIQRSGIEAVNVRVAAIAGFAPRTAQAAIAALVEAVSLKANAADFKTLGDALTKRVDDAVAAIDTRALILSQALALTGTR